MMFPEIFQDQLFDSIDYNAQTFEKVEYFNCEFVRCHFSNAHLGQVDFVECTFKECNFTLTSMQGTGLKKCQFTNCKLMGLDFSVCNDFLFTVHFVECQLDYSSFFAKKMKKTFFDGCSIKEVDFTEADLSAAIFRNSNLYGAMFDRTILEKADFRSSVNYTIDLDANHVKKTKFTLLDSAGLLHKYPIELF